MNRKMQSLIVLAAATTAAAFASPAVRAGTSQNSSGSPTQQGPFPAITISFSGQTALRTFNNSQGISTLQPGGSITLDFTPVGGGLVTYYASTDPSGYVQLAKKDFTTADSGLGATSVATAPVLQQHSALRVEWHEQGSVQGQFDLINDQVGYVSSDGGATGYLSNLNSRGPSTANPTWINSTSFTSAGTINGHSLSGANFANTYDSTVYDLPTGRNKSSGSFGGVNGQDRIQFSVGEYKTESLAKNGPAAYNALPGQAGYGLGNPVLSPAANTIGLGVANGRQQLFNESYANESTDKVDPQSATSQHYAAGPWNTAGAANIDSRQFAVTAVTYSANPGTGLSHVNKGDAQWLLTTGRLQNGADFNVVNRANDAGQRVIPAINVGIDPSWSVGENDDGNTSGTSAANVQKTLGAGIRFSGKTSGTEARNAIAQSRLGIGPLSLAEARGAASNAPVRALDVDFEHLTDSGNPADFVRANFDNIANFSYKAVLISHFNTIKAPRPDLLNNYLAANPGATSQQVQDWWNGLSSAQTGIKGDPYGNVAAFLNNIVQSVGTAGAGITPASANNPADALFGAGFLIPGLLNYSRQYDGGPLTPNNLTPAQITEQQNVKANYGPNFTPDGSFGSNSQTIGSNAYYGALNSGNTGSLALNGGTASLLITAKDALGNPVGNGLVAPKGNYLFGNFNQNGTRDFAAVKEAVNAAASLHHVDSAADSIYTADGGVSNSTVIPSLSGSPGWASTANTKGDLIILGDFNSDGRFDGKDLYLLARGASLSDNTGTDHLTTASGATFADQVRNPNAHLNKNTALDYINAALSNPANADQAFLRQTARAVVTGTSLPAGATSLSTNADGSINYTFDPTGANAFNKADVNRDGQINRQDAQIVDSFTGKDSRNLSDQLSAVVRTDINPAGTAFGSLDPASPANASIPRKSISLVDAELNDTGNIDESDFAIVRAAVGSGLLGGDANFDGTVDVTDLGILATHWQQSVDRWSKGDFSLDGVVDVTDLGILATNWQGSAGSLAAALQAFGLSSVPEPASLGLMGLAALSLRRRRRA